MTVSKEGVSAKEGVQVKALVASLMLFSATIGFAVGCMFKQYGFECEAIASGHGTYVKLENGGRVFVWKVHACHQTPATTPK